MHIDIQARSFSLTTALGGAVTRSIKPLQRRFGSRLRRIRVRLSDVNGQRGGTDKRCLIVVEGSRRKKVVAQALSSDMYQAITQAGRRAEQAFAQLYAKPKLKKISLS